MITANMVFNMRLLQDLICDFINSFSIFFTIVSVRRVSHPFIICLIETTRSGAYMNIRFNRSHKPSLFMIVFENSGLSISQPFSSRAIDTQANAITDIGLYLIDAVIYSLYLLLGKRWKTAYHSLQAHPTSAERFHCPHILFFHRYIPPKHIYYNIKNASVWRILTPSTRTIHTKLSKLCYAEM